MSSSTSAPTSISPQIRLFLDTADAVQWQTWLPIGIFYGVTTNPLLLERAQIPCTVESLKGLATQALELGVQEIHMQTWGTTVEDLVTTGKILAAIDPRVVVKIPVTSMGAEAAARLIREGIRVTLTGVYAVHQILIAAALGADYAAPYLGRITDLGHEGRDELTAMHWAIAGVNSPTRILVASIRSVDDIAYLASQGLNTFTFSPKIAAEFFNVAATNQAAIDFEDSASRMGSLSA
ncbi:MAG: transaldolase family protein [Elainellaceae cyanobacterium]